MRSHCGSCCFLTLSRQLPRPQKENACVIKETPLANNFVGPPHLCPFGNRRRDCLENDEVQRPCCAAFSSWSPVGNKFRESLQCFVLPVGVCPLLDEIRMPGLPFLRNGRQTFGTPFFTGVQVHQSADASEHCTLPFLLLKL